MSNKTIIPIIIVLSLITIGVASLTQVKRSDPKLVLNTSLSSVSENKSSSVSNPALSSTSSVSSVPKVEESKVLESVKVESVAPKIKSVECNLPESENLVKTDLGCFNIFVNPIFNFSYENTSGNFENSNPPNPKYSKELEFYYKNNIGKDFYNRIKEQSITQPIEITVTGTQKISDGGYKLFYTSSDIEYLKNNNQNNSGAGRFNAVYKVSVTNNKSFELLSFNDVKNN